jgi:hypothetical protein
MGAADGGQAAGGAVLSAVVRPGKRRHCRADVCNLYGSEFNADSIPRAPRRSLEPFGSAVGLIDP